MPDREQATTAAPFTEDGLRRLWAAIRHHPANPTPHEAPATEWEQHVMDGLRGVDPGCERALVDGDHVCTNRDGDPVRWGQACWTSARNAALRSSLVHAELADLEQRIERKQPTCRACGKPIDTDATVKCYGIDGSRYHPGACFLMEEVPA